MLSVTPQQLMDFLAKVAPVRPVFIWGAPGIGKSAIVEQFAQRMGLPCVSLLGSQLAPEDLIGVPQIVDGKSHFCPPRMIAREEPYVLFLDELNACTPEVQKAFYSLIHDRRIGEYYMPKGSIVVGAGNRKQDKALARPIASALVNRLIHVELQPNTDEWLVWGHDNHIHPSILQYLKARPDHLIATQAKDDAPFSTPRSWHMLSDALHCYVEENLSSETIQVLASGCLSSQHAGQFSAFARNWLAPYTPEEILSGKEPIPYDNPEEATFRLASVRAYLIDKLPREQAELSDETEWLVYQAIELIERTAEVDAELVRYFITPEYEDHLPPWFVQEITGMWGNILQVPEPEPTPPPSPFRRFGQPATPPGTSPLAGGNGQNTPPTRPGSRFGGSNPFQNRSATQDDGEDRPVSPFRRPSSGDAPPAPSSSPFGRSPFRRSDDDDES